MFWGLIPNTCPSKQYFVPKHSHYKITALQAPHLLFTSQVLKVIGRRERRARGRREKEEETLWMITQEGGNFCNRNSSIVYNTQMRVFNAKFSGITKN